MIAICAASSSERWNTLALLEFARARPRCAPAARSARSRSCSTSRAHVEEGVHHLAELAARAVARLRGVVVLAHAARQPGQAFDAAIGVAQDPPPDQRRPPAAPAATAPMRSALTRRPRSMSARTTRSASTIARSRQRLQARGDRIDRRIQRGVGEAPERVDVLRDQDRAQLARRRGRRAPAPARSASNSACCCRRARHRLPARAQLRVDPLARGVDDGHALVPGRSGRCARGRWCRPCPGRSRRTPP